MITLAIDTSWFVAVGIAFDGEPGPSIVVADARAHVEQLMPSLVKVCAESGTTMQAVDEFVVGMGPGPYTGLRVGIATAATLAQVGGKPLHRVCSLDALGLAAPTESEVIVASDARRKELFWARYIAGERQGEPQVSKPSSLPALPVFGAIPDEFRAEVQWAGEISFDPSLLAARHAAMPAAGAEPYYLRAADATVPGAPKSALPRLHGVKAKARR